MQEQQHSLSLQHIFLFSQSKAKRRSRGSELLVLSRPSPVNVKQQSSSMIEPQDEPYRDDHAATHYKNSSSSSSSDKHKDEETFWSYVYNLQKARNVKDTKPAKSLALYLRENPLVELLPNNMDQTTASSSSSSLVEACERALTQALRAAGEAGDYRLILSLVDASIVYANNYPILTPRSFGEALSALFRTKANISKLKYVWNLVGINHNDDEAGKAARSSFLQSPVTAFELNVMLKALASRGKTRACIDLFEQHTTTSNHHQGSIYSLIRPDAYTASTLFSILTDSIIANHRDAVVTPDRIRVSQDAPPLALSLANLSSSPCWQWNAAIQILPVLREKSQWNNHAYSALLKLQDRAQETFEEGHKNGSLMAIAILDSMMTQHDITPDVVTCTLVIKSIGDPSAADPLSWKLAVKFLNQMKSDPKLPNPNVFTYSAAIVACARCSEYNTALELLREMSNKIDSSIGSETENENNTFDHPPQPNTWVYNAALLAISNSEDKKDWRDKKKSLASTEQVQQNRRNLALSLLEQMREDHAERAMDTKPDTVTYNTVISIIATARGDFNDEDSSSDEKVIYLIKQMKNDNILRDSITYRNAIVALTSDKEIFEILRSSLEDIGNASSSINKQKSQQHTTKPLVGKASHGLTFVFNSALSVLASRANLKMVKEVFSLMQKEKIAFNAETTTHLINILGRTGKSSMIAPLLTALSTSDMSVFSRQQLLDSTGLELFSKPLPPLETSHFPTAISVCLAANELKNAHSLLTIMRNDGMTPTSDCTQNFCLAYARVAITSAAKEKKRLRQQKAHESVSQARAQSAYSIAMAIPDAPPHVLSTVSKACAVTGQWQQSRSLLRLVHKRLLTPDEPLIQLRGIDLIQGLHSSLLRECSNQGNVTAGLWFASDIQAFSRNVHLKREEVSVDVTDTQEQDLLSSLRQLASTAEHGAKNVGMRPEDWVSLVKAASKSGHWRVCINTLQFLRPYVMRTNPNLNKIEDSSILEGRYEQLATAITVAVRCLEVRSQYAWAVRAIDDWIEWSGRKPRPEAVLSAMRILSARGRGEETMKLLNRCIEEGPPTTSYAKKGVGYEELLYIGAVTSLHGNGLYDDADEVFISGLSRGRLPFAFEKQKDQFVLDLHGMNVALAHSAVRVAMRQQVASYNDETCNNNMMIITGRGRNSELRLRPVLRPEIQRMLLEEFYPPLNTVSMPGNMGALLVLAEDISQWHSHQQEQKGARMLTIAAVLKNLSQDRLKRSIALTLESNKEKGSSS